MPQSIGAIVALLYLIVLLGLIGLAAWRLLSAPRCPPTTRVQLHFNRKHHRMSFNPGQTALLTATPNNGDGVLNSPNFTASDPNIASISATADPLVVQVTFNAVGHVDFSFTATNSVGDGVSSSIGADVVEVPNPTTDVTLSFS